MTAVLPVNQPSTAYVGETIDLLKIFQNEVNCCVLRRRPNFEIMNFIHQLNSTIQVQQMVSCQEELLPQISSSLSSEVKALSGIDAFLQEVGEVVEIYGLLLGAEQVGMRLITLDRAMCPGFHVDKIGIRLVCTYRGPATQWLENRDADRSKLGLMTQGISDQESGLIKNPAAVRSMQPLDIGLLKGEAWMNQDGSLNKEKGVVHRSPQVDEGLRLLLTLDAF